MKPRLAIGLAFAALTALIGNTAHADAGIPPVVNLSWTPNHVLPGGVTQIRLDIGNPGTTAALTGVAFDITLPAGLSVGNIGATAIACGTVSATAPNQIHYTNGTVAANTPSVNSPCNFSINITTSTEGSFPTSTTAPSSNEGGSGSVSSATLTVGSPPSIAASFGAATMAVGQSTTLTYTLSNANTTTSALGVGFNNTLPSGLVVATPNGASNTCGGTLTAAAGTGTVQLSGGTLAASSSCVVSLNVTANTSGTKNNSVQVTTTNLGNGNTSNTSITVLAPLSVSEAFGAPTANVGQNVSLTYTLTNPNAGAAASGVDFNNVLPSGLVVATPNGLASTCGGSATATAGSGSVQLTGGSIAASGSCTVTVNLTPTSAGTKNNSFQATSTNTGTSNTANASLTVNAPLSVVQAFGAPSVNVGQSTSLTYTISNPNAGTAASGMGFTNTLPAGLVVATPNALTNSCGGSVTAAPGSSSIQLSGGSLAASSNCSIVVNVTATTSGTFNNSVQVATANLGNSNTANASLTAAIPSAIPTLSEWAMLLLATLLGLTAMPWHRRNR